MGIISDMFQHRMKSIIVLSLSMTVVLLQTGCSFKNNDQASNSIPQKLCDNVVVSAKPDIGTQVTLPTYTAIIGEKVKVISTHSFLILKNNIFRT